MEKYIRDYDEIFKDQSEDLRENTMVDWGMMKQAWMELVDEEFFRKTKEKFVEMRTYEGATQRDIFELMDKTMLDHRLRKEDPKEAYHRHLRDLSTSLRKAREVENIQPVGGQKVSYTQARKAVGGVEHPAIRAAKGSKKVSNEHRTLPPALAPKDKRRKDKKTKGDEEMDLGSDKVNAPVEQSKVSHEHIPAAPVLAPQIPTEEAQGNTARAEKTIASAQTTEETQAETFVDEDMDSGVVVSHEHTPSAPVLAHKIPSEDRKEDPSMVICGGLSTVPPADVDPGKKRKPVGTKLQPVKQMWIWLQERTNTVIKKETT